MVMVKAKSGNFLNHKTLWMKRLFLSSLFFLTFNLINSGYAQNYTFISPSTNLTVDVLVVNECNGSADGSVQFTVVSSLTSEDANLAIFNNSGFTEFVVGVPLPFGVPVVVSLSPPGLNTDTYSFSITSATSGGISDNVAVENMGIIAFTKVTETDNSSCITPNGQVEASITGGSLDHSGGIASFEYTWTSNNGLVGLPLGPVTWDGTGTLDLATLLAATGLPGGTYTLDITDNFSTCIGSVDFTIIDPSPSDQLITTSTPLSICNGDNATIDLAGSELSVTYEILVNGIGSGFTTAGTGGPISIIITTGNFADTDVLTIEGVNGSCTPIILSGSVTIDLNNSPNPALAVTAGADPICENTATTIDVALSELGYSYQLRNDLGDVNIGAPVIGTGATINLPTGALTTAITFNVLATIGGCIPVELTTLVTVNVDAAPNTALVVTAAADPICESGSTTIDVDLSEVGYSYQLRNDLGDLNIGAPVIGTGVTINLPTGALTTTTTFNVLVTNGTCSVELATLSTVNVNLNPNTALAVTAAADPICEGSATTIDVALSEASVSYQLRNDLGDVNIGASVIGTGATINLPTGALGLTTTFNVLATSGVCAPAELTTLVTVNVDAAPNTALVITAAADPICESGSTTIDVDLSEVGYSYQLRNDAGDLNIGAPVIGTGVTINLPTGALTTTTTFNVLVTNGTCSVELATLSTVNVNLNPNTALAVTAAADPICEGSATTIDVALSEASVSYQLRNDLGDVNIGAPVIGTGATINLPTGALGLTTTFNVLATSGVCAPAELTTLVTVNVDAAPNTALVVTAAADPICESGSTTIDVDLSEAGYSYQLRNDLGDVNIGAPVIGTGVTINLPTGALTTTTTFNVLVTNGTCSVELATLVTVNVDAAPNTALVVTAAADPICESGSTTIDVDLSEAGYSYQLRNDLGDVNIGAPVIGTGVTINLPTGALTTTTTFNVLVTNGTCSVELATLVTVNVDAAPNTALVVTAAADPICESGSTTIDVDLSEVGYSYQLRNDLGDVNIGAPVIGTGATINLPTGALTTTTTFNVLVTNGTCSVELATLVTVNVDAAPNTGLTVTAAADPICESGSTTIDVDLSEVGYSYQLRNDLGDVNIGAPVIGTGATINLPTGALTTTTTFNVLVTNGTCSVELVTLVTVNVNLNPNTALAVTAAADPICEGSATTIDVDLSEVGYSYQLRNDLGDVNIGAPVIGTGATINLPTGALALTTTFNVLATSGVCTPAELTTLVTVNVDAAPNTGLTVTAAADPICESGSTTIDVDLSEVGYSYQLRNDLGDVNIGAPVIGTGATINLPTGALTTTTTFNVLVTNGTCSVELTTLVTVNVNLNPNTALAVTAAADPICEGSATTIDVDLSEVGYSYQLRNDLGDVNIGAPVIGTGATINLPTGALALTTTFNVLATSGVCTPAELTTLVTVNVDAAPNTGLTVTAAADPICESGSTTIDVDLSEVGYSYQLRNDLGDVNIGAPVIGTGATINLPTGALTTTTTFNVLVTNGTCSVELATLVTVNVDAAPNTGLTVTAAADPICESGSTTIDVDLSEVGYSYQLRNDLGDVNIGAPVIGTGATINLPTGALTTTTTFNVLVTNGTCSVELATLVTVNVDAAPNTGLTVTAAADPICEGSATTIDVALSEAGVSYQLRNDLGDVNIGAPVIGTGATINLPTGALALTTTFNVLATSGVCTPAELTTLVTVNVDAAPNTGLTVTAAADPICESGSTTIDVDLSEVGYSYQLRNDLGDVNIGAPVIGTGATINLPTGALTTTTTFNVLVTNGTCSVELTTLVTVNVNLNPNTALAVTAAADPICEGSATTIDVALSEAGVSYQLRNDLGDVNIGAPVIGTGATINLPTGALALTTTFNVLATSGVCTPAELTTLVTVNVDAAPNTGLTVTAAADPICESGSTTIDVDLSEVGYSYQLRNDLGDVNIGAPVIGTGATINLPTGALTTTTTFNVLVTNGTCSVELTTLVTVNVNLNPNTALAVTAAADPICEGSATTIDVALSEAGVSYQLRNDLGDVNIGAPVIGTGATINLPTGALALTTTFNVLATSGVCTPAELTTLVTVNVDAAPNTGLTVTAAADPICESGSTTIDVDLSEVGYSYQLRNDAGDVNIGGAVVGTGATINLPTGALTTTTIFNVLVTNGTCSVELTTLVTVNVNPLPIPTITPTAAVCAGDTEIYVTEAAMSNYVWIVNGGTITAGGGSNIIVIDWDGAGPLYDITVSYDDVNVCNGTTTEVITVQPSGAASVSIVADQNPVCTGANVTFTATPTNGGAVPTFQWQVNSANVVGEVGTTFTSNSLNDLDDVTVIMTADATATCVTGSPATSNTITMSVSGALAASVAIAVDQNPVCTGDNVTFTATPTNGGAIPAFQWQINNANVVGEVGTTFTSNSLNDLDNVTVIMTADATATCVTGSPTTSNSIAMSVSGSLAASVSIVADKNPVCTGDNVTFTATPTNGGAVPAFQWQVNSANVVGEVGTTFTSNTLNDLDDVTVIMTADATATCVTGSPATSNSLIMSIIGAIGSAPIATSASNILCTSFDANWNVVAGATTYRVEIASDIGFTSIFINQSVSTNILSVTAGISQGTNYFYRVYSVNACGESILASNEINLTTSITGCGGGGTDCGLFTTIDPILTRPTCTNNNDGSIAFDIQGGTGNYLVEMIDSDSNPFSTQSAVPTFNNLSPSTYTYKVTDLGNSNICDDGRSVTLEILSTVEGELLANSTENISCFGETGAVTLTNITPVLANYYYSIGGGSGWTLLPGSNRVEGLSAGITNIRLGAAADDQCPDIIEVTISTTNPIIVVDATSTNLSTCDSNDGQVSVDFPPTGGANTASDDWSIAFKRTTSPVTSNDFGTFSEDVIYTNLTADSYTLYIRDIANCTISEEFNIGSPGQIVVDKNNSYIQQASCDLPQSGSVTMRLDFTNFVAPPFTVSIASQGDPTTIISESTGWDGDTRIFPQSATGLISGNYTATVSSATSGICAGTYDFTITGGAIPVSFDYELQQRCLNSTQEYFNELLLTNITGEAGVDYTLTVFNDLQQVNDMIPLTVQIGNEIRVTGRSFLQTFDKNFKLRLSQTQSVCTENIIFDHQRTLKVPKQLGTLVVTVDNIKTSLPERNTGSFRISTITGGVSPYMAVLEGGTIGFPGLGPDEVPFDAFGGKFTMDYTKLGVGDYALFVTDTLGCEIEVGIEITRDFTLFIPNVFTPNGDGVNDTFFIRNLPDEGGTLVVSNRWGKEVYFSENYTNDSAWGGEDTPEGIYFYKLEASGNVYTGWVEVMKGFTP
jgi:gliding motility-associated-like protein